MVHTLKIMDVFGNYKKVFYRFKMVEKCKFLNSRKQVGEMEKCKSCLISKSRPSKTNVGGTKQRMGMPKELEQAKKAALSFNRRRK